MEKHDQVKLFPKRLLIVDDTPINLNFLAKVLTEEGYEVHKALHGQKALDLCASILPDLILLDVRMPKMDGYEVCQRLKENPQTHQIPIIFISALDQVFNKVQAFQVGGVDYITKPFDREEVICRIENHLNLRSLQVELEQNNRSLEQEIQERKKVQSALEASEQNNRALLNAIPDLMMRISDRGLILDYRVQEAATTTDDTVIEELIVRNATIFPVGDPRWLIPLLVGKQVSEIFSADLTLWITYYVEQTLQTSNTQVGEYMQQVHGKWHAYEVRYVQSGTNEVLALVRDISERKRAEAERMRSQAMLTTQKQQLEHALRELKTAQVQLVQTEKMAALGQLVAGIAHEINNPINYISGNLNHANQYVQDLVSILQAYQQEYSQPTAQIQELIDDLDIDFVVEDVQNLISSMKKGAERIRAIVLSLRNFSRLDEAEMKQIDIHEGIDSTLVMLQHRLRETKDHSSIEVIKNYGDLPQVTCYASQMNQVFMHIINNAVDALNVVDFSSSLKPTIKISTEYTENDTVKIQIADSGLGISEEHRTRLFDPFFTTKPVGSGTGLGLSISYQIVVQKHKGQLSCHSLPGQGAEFIIEIPVHQPEFEKAS